jgi:predicted N-acyltransferase
MILSNNGFNAYDVKKKRMKEKKKKKRKKERGSLRMKNSSDID